ncbi:hypothetical protein LTR36_004094 [Oleoguttula mirabilis]|uniref:Uncharacterized protein n=1 Tax=Oleoguttula mirabilis TaxID=1507867 RepID=A0AAV9JGT3_9PEZI|nr:hypothetical protein LTR36_004094 [Oleoguttula mirabilis]
MSSTSQDRTSTDASSTMTKSSTSSTVQLLKSKFTSKSKSPKPKDERSPGEKQTERRSGRLNTESLATTGALR